MEAPKPMGVVVEPKTVITAKPIRRKIDVAKANAMLTEVAANIGAVRKKAKVRRLLKKMKYVSRAIEIENTYTRTKNGTKR